MKLKTILVAFVALPSLLSSCKKNNDDDYPKSVNIQYKVSSPSGLTQATSVIYMNETGALTNLSNQALPYTKSLSRTVNRGDALSLRADAVGNGSLKLEILVNNEVVKTSSPSGSTTITGTIVHQFQ
ncbi:MAG: hypothetical protein KF741_10730 [Ferruginibacter sp.]|nr:hypothetical protein [Bacteroidota bacterium]MBX2919705.1 hypothetical protein [Ferruginibacter sp.]MCC7379138.1 hypothetical protein [Chitinophagaceae bacterium]